MDSSEQERTPGLYEVYAARASADLSQCHIYHDALVAWDDEDALRRVREKAGSLYADFDLRRVMDVRI